MSERLAIVGSRNWPNAQAVEEFVFSLPWDTTVVSGGAPGVDTWAVDASRTCGLSYEVIPADWDHHGKAAGVLRNQKIVNRVDRLVAFWDGKSRGTQDVIKRARAKGIPVEVYEVEDLLLKV